MKKCPTKTILVLVNQLKEADFGDFPFSLVCALVWNILVSFSFYNEVLSKINLVLVIKN